MGDVIADGSSLENQFLYDEKDIYLQFVDPSMTFNLVTDLHTAYHFLVRVWDGQSWSLGPVFEVKVDRNEKASKLALLLSERLGLDAEHLVCTKVSPGKSFRRGELLLRRWNKLRYQQVWLG